MIFIRSPNALPILLRSTFDGWKYEEIGAVLLRFASQQESRVGMKVVEGIPCRRIRNPHVVHLKEIA
jgi:hypothetical protein